MPALDVDVSLHYELGGSGWPVVLLHGFTSSFRGNWHRRGWPDLLARNGFRVVGLDFRSHGESERVYDANAVTTDVLARDVVALLDHLEIARTSVFGFSMGGGVALRLAMDDPERVERLVVAGVGDAALNRLHDPRQIADVLAAFEAEAPSATAPPVARAIRRSAELGGGDAAALAPFLRNGGWPGGIGVERAVRVPALIVVAASDQYMPQVDELLRLVPHAQVERVAEGDHYTVLDDESVRAAVVRFLKGG